MIKAVIFDLDGVLVSTDELHYQAWKRLAEEFKISSFTREDNIRQRGVSRMESLEVVLEKSSQTYDEDQKIELAERKNRYYVESLSQLTKEAVLPGVLETLMMLRKNNIAIAVGSASKNTLIILERTGLKEYIDEISCGLDVTKSKPDPEVFIIAAKKLGMLNEECLVVEDSEAGIIAAQRAHMTSLGVGENYQLLHADFAVRSFNQEVPWKEILNLN